MSSAKFPVRVTVAGGETKVVMVGSGGTVGSALRAAKIDPAQFGGSLTVNGEEADVTTRLSKADYVLASPKVSGGR